MIRLENICKTFVTSGMRKTVADEISVTFPTGARVGLLGRNGAGKSTLMKIIGGYMTPDSGRITSTGSISPPVGISGSFHQDLTGAQNTRFVARIFGVDTEELVHFVQDFADLGKYFFLPVRTYSGGMKGRLAFGVSMGIPFDYYLLDEATGAGDASFKEKSAMLFKDRMMNAGALWCTHSAESLRELCQMAAVLENGRITLHEDVDDAIEHHSRNLGVSTKAAAHEF